MRKRLFIYCEGQTEEMFVERLLRNHLALHGVKVERPELCATSLDLYRLPPRLLSLAGFAGPVSLPADVERLEAVIENVFSEPRFKAYLQRHELEALLLADPDALERVFHRDRAGLQTLRSEIAGFAQMEDINHGPTTHPAARLATAVAGYENLKASNAYFVLAQAGLDNVRTRCPRFDAWLSHWERWGMGH